MQSPPHGLQALRDTGLMDTPREEAFDRLARLAADILNVPLTIESVYTDRFVLKAASALKMAADPIGLRRIVENLASNAAKYGAPDAPIEVLLDRSGDQVMLQVKNQGNPIAGSELLTIFEPFHRSRSATESAQKGWGIGLPLVKGIAEAHGGTAAVTSSARDGTCFTITLPLTAAPPESFPAIAGSEHAGTNAPESFQS